MLVDILCLISILHMFSPYEEEDTLIRVDHLSVLWV